MEDICEENFKRNELICRRIPKCHGEETGRQIWGGKSVPAQQSVAWLLGKVDSGECREVVQKSEEEEIKRKQWPYEEAAEMDRDYIV